MPAKVWNAACRPPAVKKLAMFLQGCRVRLPGKAGGQGCNAMVQYAESMVKLENNAAFWLMCPQEEQEDNKAKLRRTNAGKKLSVNQITAGQANISKSWLLEPLLTQEMRF
jgi:hypothetical protein